LIETIFKLSESCPANTVARRYGYKKKLIGNLMPEITSAWALFTRAELNNNNNYYYF